jgi:hypothetical protein
MMPEAIPQLVKGHDFSRADNITHKNCHPECYMGLRPTHEDENRFGCTMRCGVER